jgi:hypothetical protein
MSRRYIDDYVNTSMITPGAKVNRAHYPGDKQLVSEERTKQRLKSSKLRQQQGEQEKQQQSEG